MPRPRSDNYRLRPNLAPPMELPKPTSNTTMTDESIMPFGKYKGEPMRKVDPEYLLWLWEGANSPMMHSKSGGVAEYIRKNLKTIMAGAPDKIVIHTSTTPP